MTREKYSLFVLMWVVRNQHINIQWRLFMAHFFNFIYKSHIYFIRSCLFIVTRDPIGTDILNATPFPICLTYIAHLWQLSLCWWFSQATIYGSITHFFKTFIKMGKLCPQFTQATFELRLTAWRIPDWYTKNEILNEFWAREWSYRNSSRICANGRRISMVSVTATWDQPFFVWIRWYGLWGHVISTRRHR